MDDEEFEKIEEPSFSEKEQGAMDEVLARWSSKDKGRANPAQKNSETVSGEVEMPSLELTNNGPTARPGREASTSTTSDVGSADRKASGSSDRGGDSEPSKTERKAADGNTITEFKNDPDNRVRQTDSKLRDGGSLKTTDFEGRKDNLIQTKEFRNTNDQPGLSGVGRTESLFKDGRKVTEYDISHRNNIENLQRVTETKGSKLSEFQFRKDGLQSVEESGNATVSRFAERTDGLKTEVKMGNYRSRDFSGRHDNVTTEIEYGNHKDGKTKYIGRSDGTSESHYKDGKVVKLNADGSGEVHKDGKVTKIDEAGEEIKPAGESKKEVKPAREERSTMTPGREASTSTTSDSGSGDRKTLGSSDRGGDSEPSKTERKAADGNTITEFKNDPDNRVRQTDSKLRDGGSLKTTDFEGRKDNLIQTKEFRNTNDQPGLSGVGRTESLFKDGRKVTEYDISHRNNIENLQRVTETKESKLSEFQFRKDGLQSVDESGKTKISRFADRTDGLKTEVTMGTYRSREFSGRQDNVTTEITYGNHKDGKTKYIGRADGTSESHYKDGKVVKINADGSETHKNGKVTKSR